MAYLNPDLYMVAIGNLGSDVETRYLQSGEVVRSASIAISDKWTDKTTGEKREKTTWIRLNMWGSFFDGVSKYLTKGQMVYVMGTPKASAYIKDNEARSSQEINVVSVKLLGRANGGGNDQRQPDSGYEPAGPDVGDGDDIPF